MAGRPSTLVEAQCSGERVRCLGGRHKPISGSGMEGNRPRRLPDGWYCSSQAPQHLFLIENPTEITPDGLSRRYSVPHYSFAEPQRPEDKRTRIQVRSPLESSVS